MKPDSIRFSRMVPFGNECCIYEKLVGPEGKLLHTPVIFEGISEHSSFLHGRKDGRVTTGFFPQPPLSRNVGDIFWMKDSGLIVPVPLSVAAHSPEEKK